MFSASVGIDRDEVVVVVSGVWFGLTFDSEAKVVVEGVVSSAMVFNGVRKKMIARKKVVLVFFRYFINGLFTIP